MFEDMFEEMEKQIEKHIEDGFLEILNILDPFKDLENEKGE